MLLTAGYDASAYQPAMMNYAPVADDVARYMAASIQRKTSRGSTGPRPSIRVMKTTSVNNSPRGSIGGGRRRTPLMNGPAQQRRLTMYDHAINGMGIYTNDFSTPPQNSRPYSWHASSQVDASANYPSSYPYFAQCNGMAMNPSDYSGYTSPATAVSPISMPYYSHQPTPYPTDDSNYFSPSDASMSYAPLHVPNMPQQFPSTNPTSFTQLDWDNFAANGFGSTADPLTPESFIPAQHPHQSFPSDDAIPYQSLDDEEPTGEVLVGMGLYDTPEKEPAADPQLDSYRVMMSQLLGTTYRKEEAPQGKGLKLEETWNPPATDDDEEDAESEEDDAEEAKEEAAVQSSTTFPSTEQYMGNGWL